MKPAAFGEGGGAGGVGAGERVEHDAAGRRDLHQFAHQLDRLLRDVDALARGVHHVEPGRRVWQRVERAGSVGAPHEVLAVVGEPALGAAAVGFGPDEDAAPDEPGGLQRVGHGGGLAPVGEHGSDATGGDDAAGVGEPQGGPERDEGRGLGASR